MALQLAPFIDVGIDGDALYLGFGSAQSKITGPKKWRNLVLSGTAFWCEPREPEEVRHYALTQGATSDEANRLIRLLVDGNYLIPAGSYNASDRFSRQGLFFWLCGGDALKAQQKISSRSVAIVGCGGIGNQVSVSLATAGVRELILIDDDKIELSNLSRQHMFTESDVGCLKIDVLEKALRSRASSLSIVKKPVRVGRESDLVGLESVDLIVLSGDDPGLDLVVNRFSLKRDVPSIHVGYVEDVAVWGPLVVPGETGCMYCNSVFADDVPGDACAVGWIQTIKKNYQPPSIGPINSTAASLATLDILKFLAELGGVQAKNRRVGVWTDRNEFEFQRFAKNPECKECGWVPLKEVNNG